MPYEFRCRNFYDKYDVYDFHSGHQQVNVYFVHLIGINYRAVIWAEDGNRLIQPHMIEFQETVWDIIDHYDAGRNYVYESFAE